MAKHILVVDDEARIREVVEYALSREGYAVSVAVDGAAAVERFAQGDIDLVVLDVMLPKMDGFSVCRTLRETRSVPILFLSARADEVDRIVGLEVGGDDYLVKPFSVRELVARVRAILRRVAESSPRQAASTPAPPSADHGAVCIDAERHEVRCHNTAIALTATEFGVLSALYERPGVVLSRGQLMQRAYQYDNLITERTIDTHVRRIRAKFRPHGVDPIATVFGVGYKAFVADEL